LNCLASTDAQMLEQADLNLGCVWGCQSVRTDLPAREMLPLKVRHNTTAAYVSATAFPHQINLIFRHFQRAQYVIGLF